MFMWFLIGWGIVTLLSVALFIWGIRHAIDVDDNEIPIKK